MISYRRSDLLNDFKIELAVSLNIETVGAVGQDAQSNEYWRVEISLMREDVDFSRAVERVIMSGDDFKKVAFSTPINRQMYGEYGFQGQWMESEDSCKFLINEIMTQLRNIDGVKEVKSEPNEENDGILVGVFI